MIDVLNAVALCIGYSIMIFWGAATAAASAWWCFEIVAKHAGWLVSLNRAVTFYRRAMRKEIQG